MSDAEKIKSEYEDTIRPFFSSDPTVSVTVDDEGRHDAVTVVTAVVRSKGNGVDYFNLQALREKLKGTNVEERIVIEGTSQGRRCRVTVICTPQATPEA